MIDDLTYELAETVMNLTELKNSSCEISHSYYCPICHKRSYGLIDSQNKFDKENHFENCTFVKASEIYLQRAKECLGSKNGDVDE